MKKRVVSIISLVIFSLSLIGCFSYSEINQSTFATSIIFDKDEYDNVILYLDCVRPYRDAGQSSDKGKRILFQGKGKTALEALRDMDGTSSNKLNFTQVRAYVFTEEAARNGIKNYLDLINNNQQFSFKPYMFVYFGNIDELLKQTSGDEEYLGLYLDQLVDKNRENGKVLSSNVNDYISDSLKGNNLSFMTGIIMKDKAIDRKLELNGGVIMKDNHLVGLLDDMEVLSYNLLNNKVRQGTFEVTNPEERDKFITLDILEHYTETNIKEVNETFVLDKNIQIKVSIGEIQGRLRVNNKVLNEIEDIQERKLKNYLEDFFEKYKKQGIDVLGVTRSIEEEYPKNNIKDSFDKTKLNVSVDIVIDGTSNVKDSL